MRRSFGSPRGTTARTVASISTVGLLLAACGAQTDPAQGGDGEPVTVALSVPESLPFLPADLGPSQGAFESCGVQVENITGESSTVGRSLAAGEADIAVQSASRAVGEIMQGLPLTLVGGQKNPWSQVLVVSSGLYSDEGIQTPDDVRSLDSRDERTQFGISSFGSAGELSVRRLTEEFGWEEGNEAELVPLGGVNEIAAGLESGSIDAFTWNREVAYRMESEGVGHVIEDVTADAVGSTVFEAMVASDAFIEERPDDLQAYMKCYYDYVQKLKGDPEEVRRLAQKEWGRDDETLEEILEMTIGEWNPDGSVSDEELEGLARDAVFQNDEIDEAPIGEWWSYWKDLN